MIACAGEGCLVRHRTFLGSSNSCVSLNLECTGKKFILSNKLNEPRRQNRSQMMSGAPCFAGTRVPIQNLIDYLEGGDSIEDFLEGFPSVSRKQVIAFLEEAKDRMLAEVSD